MSTGAASKETLPFTADQKQVVSNLASATLMVTGLLFLLGVIQLGGGVAAWFWRGAGFFPGLLMVLQGALCAFLGLVLLAVSSDFKFLGLYPQYSGNHFRNAAKNLTAFYNVQMVLALLMALVVLIRLFIMWAG